MARRSAQLVWSDPPSGTPGDDLASVEAELGVCLPEAVRTFFSTAQARTRWLLPELTTDWARLRLYREAAQDLLRDSRAEFRLGHADVVFLVPHEYEFFFFPCDCGEDPPVYRFIEGERRPRQVAGSFTEWTSRLR